MSTGQKFKTFVTEQKTILLTQIGILFGLLIQVIMFFSLIWYGRPPAIDTALVLQFFTVCALWIITINIGVVLFWWVSSLGDGAMFYKKPEVQIAESAPESEEIV